MKVRIANFWISNGDADSPANLVIDEQRSGQVASGLRWKQKKVFDRGNKQTTVSFDVQRVHASIGDAENFVLTHGLTVPNNGLVELQLNGGGSIFLEAAECQGVVTRHTGVSTTTSYTIVGGAMLTRKPSS